VVAKVLLRVLINKSVYDPIVSHIIDQFEVKHLGLIDLKVTK